MRTHPFLSLKRSHAGRGNLAESVAGGANCFAGDETGQSQSYISTNWVTPGLQYDGRAWNLPTKVPIAISSNIAVAYGNPTTLSFTANAGMATNLWTATLWQAGDITGLFQVVNGFHLTNTSSGVFKIQNPPTNQLFWFITTQ